MNKSRILKCYNYKLSNFQKEIFLIVNFHKFIYKIYNKELNNV